MVAGTVGWAVGDQVGLRFDTRVRRNPARALDPGRDADELGPAGLS